ncbi:MAG: bifunctional diaminohydroxyphosphoribosylaminopyrimidine deaminase/5-amino-6-(5-phosphoribosylamino)uracil reductase RibD [Lachnospiraceae bacterium]|nr:bifunctional diaminohydroxyphosphoribosylaminopyrimidine deaminase/5-amino-6-(5-phosphoribosylamino)uracil reductase RibD [Lachnospiraceae bacterium]
MNDEFYMRRALELATMGRGNTNPNPMVGAVIVKEGRIIGEGYHERYGELHAERNALKNCIESPEGATVYVSLEPCCHHGKTPPCTDALIESGIGKVVVGMLDVNPIVAGNGVNILIDHGIEVVTGVLEDECRRLNRIFIKYITEKLPYVVMKYGMTADGKIATVTGESKWITGPSSRENVHRTRHSLMGIMVGIGTVIADDPMLDCRLPEGGKNPVRIICDSSLRTPMDSKIVKTATEIRTIIATVSTDESLIKEYESKGLEVVRTSGGDGKVNLKELMRILGEMGIDSILLEGGAQLNFSALNSRIVDEVHTYISPKIFGGDAKTPVGGKGIEKIDDAVMIKPFSITGFDDDIFVESEVRYSVHGDS